jgi:hypothetical protein
LLTTQQERYWHDVVTLDESWFYRNTDHDRTWLRADEKVSEKERHAVHSEKSMSTIVWNPSGFHLITVLSKGIKFNANHYITDILVQLLESRIPQVDGNDRKLIVYAENARPHTAGVTLKFLKEKKTKKAPHPPYSPDLAPSDFYLLSLRPHQARRHHIVHSILSYQHPVLLHLFLLC